MNTWNDGNVEIHRSKIKEKDKRIAELEMSLKRIEDAEDKVYQAYEERIADLEAKLAQAKISEEDAWSEFRELSVRDGKIITALESAEAEAMSVVASLEGTVGRFKAERDQLAASMETHNVARQKAEQRELAVCAELDEVRANLETARKALEAVDGLVTCSSVTMEQAYFRFITTGQGDVIELVRQALAQIATLEERDRAADAGYVDVEITVKYRRSVYHTVAEDMKHLTPRELAQQDLDDVIAASVREFGLEGK